MKNIKDDETYPVSCTFTMQFPKSLNPAAFEYAGIVMKDGNAEVTYSIDCVEYKTTATLVSKRMKK